MKFEVGDKVTLLHSGEEGIVVEILDEEMVSVNVKGVVFPAYVDQLDFPYFERFRSKGTGKRPGRLPRGEELPVEKAVPLPRDETGVWLSFLPEYETTEEEPLVRTFRIHLLNETAPTFSFHYRMLLNGALELEVKNVLSPFTHFYLNDLPFESLNDRPRFGFVFSLAEADPQKAESHALIFRPKARQVMQKLRELQQRQEATFSYLLFQKYPDKAEEHTESWEIPASGMSVPIRASDFRTAALPTYEVDLHIEKLYGHPEQLTAAEMLMMQLGELQKQLDLAIARRQFSLVVIHGIGKGKLRDEVHEVLRHIPEVKSFVNQYDFRYGYGATEIFFEYK
jgi:hypothetical protein